MNFVPNMGSQKMGQNFGTKIDPKNVTKFWAKKWNKILGSTLSQKNGTKIWDQRMGQKSGTKILRQTLKQKMGHEVCPKNEL